MNVCLVHVRPPRSRRLGEDLGRQDCALGRALKESHSARHEQMAWAVASDGSDGSGSAN